MSNGHQAVELASTKSWKELDEVERLVFENWLVRASGRDLYLLLRFALRFRKRSSAQLEAVQPGRDDEITQKVTLPAPPKDED